MRSYTPLIISQSTYAVAYFVPATRSWTYHEEMDHLGVKVISELCMRLGRPFKVKHLDTGIVFEGRPKCGPSDLNLFYNRINDRTLKMLPDRAD